MPWRTVFSSRADRALRRAKAALEAASEALFPPKSPCLICKGKLKEDAVRPVCHECTGLLRTLFEYVPAADAGGTKWARNSVGGIIRPSKGAEAILRGMDLREKSAAAGEIAKAAALCLPLRKFMRIDGVFLSADGTDQDRAAWLRGLCRGLASNLACGYEGAPYAGIPEWQRAYLKKPLNVRKRPACEYPLLVSLGDFADGGALALGKAGAAEVTLLDAEGL